MSVGSTVMSSGPQNGVCVKCTMRRSGLRLRSWPGDERELVVLHEHDLVLIGLVGGSLRERVVHGDVRVPRVAEVHVEARAPDAIEHAVEAGTRARRSR